MSDQETVAEQVERWERDYPADANGSATSAAKTFPIAEKTTSEPTSVANIALVAPEWPQMDAAALHGVAGDMVRTIEPHSEADPVAILLQMLVFAGNVIGRLPFYQIESDQHHANLFAVLVGASAKARKHEASASRHKGCR